MVIYQLLTELGPYEEAVIHGLLDPYRNYDSEQPLLLEPRKTELMQPLIAARIVVNFTLAIMPILVSNISSERVTIPNGNLLADDKELTARRVDHYGLSALPNFVASVSINDLGLALQTDTVAKAMKNADKSLIFEQRVLPERLHRKHTSIFDASVTDIGRTSLMNHRIDIGNCGPVRQPMRRVPTEHIPVLKAYLTKLKNAGALVPSTSSFASLTILDKKDGSIPLCINY